MELSHLDDRGRAKMVDVTEKEVTLREARAEGRISMKPETLRLIMEGGIQKGEVLAVARLAGIMAAKRTSELIPLCHTLSLTSVAVGFTPEEASSSLKIEAVVKLYGRTGAEMEALVAVAVAALTVYDMCKAVDRGMTIHGIRLLEKRGGKSGAWVAEGYRGEVVSVNISKELGVPKRRVQEGVLKEDWGLEGDAHAGTGGRQVSLLPLEAMALVPPEIMAEMEEGAYSENLTICGIPLEELRVGRRLKVGEAVVEILQIGKGRLEARGRPWIVSREGRFGRVLKGGSVKVGDEVVLIG